MNLSPVGAHLRVRKILSLFNKRWHPNGQKKVFLDVFSLEAWKLLPVEVKNKHTIKNCDTCCTEHSSLTKAFPYKQAGESNKTSIDFNTNDLSSPTNLGRKALDELDTICKQQFQVSAQEVLTSTPKANFIVKPSSQQRQSEKRKVV